ncbi:MAG: AraC family transcriptional regulator [Bacteroidota bacterium]|nr:AraC family transcriptional regulator [Bacteroidota bacterium]
MPAEIHIKNMVCPRCIHVVKSELTRSGFNVIEAELGKVVLQENDPDLNLISEVLKTNGFDLLEEKTARLIKDIKIFIIQLIRDGSLENNKKNISALLETHFHKEHKYLSQLFSNSENITLEKYFIAQKVEQVKEWLVYNELTLSEMAFRLGYSSVAHLSSQFKQVTGFTPSNFRELKDHRRKSLDEV